MRFHKARKITASDAELLVATSFSSLNGNVVISLDDDWYDVRLMTRGELNAFVTDLLRHNLTNLQSSSIIPH